MANKKHLALLEKGVGVWNQWRKENSDIRLDLIRADLSEAILRGTDLSEAKLIEADLSGAILSGAGLSRAILKGADLSYADLGYADLKRADLSYADLSGAGLFETVFGNINLTDAKGLESCVYHGPSTIDHRTIMRSGRLPLEFYEAAVYRTL